MRLPEWLAHQQAQHPEEIELGLARVREVAERLGVLPWRIPSILIGGTNGKGSTVAFLGSLARAEGIDYGAYTSPHLRRYNERITLNGDPVSDERLESVFAEIEAARLGSAGQAPIRLTFFEYGTLAALLIFDQEATAGRLQMALIEVGLGGRLDATNIIDADVAAITSIGLDHTDWLGPTLEHIGAEKAPIARRDRPVILGQASMPESVHRILKEIGARPRQLGVDFAPFELPESAMRAPIQASNAASALAAYRALRPAASLSDEAARQAMSEVTVPGRLQRHRDRAGLGWILDVAHNGPAAEALAAGLAATARPRYRYAVVGMFADKDAGALFTALRDQVDGWILCGLAGERGAGPEALRVQLGPDQRCLALVPDVIEGCALARALAESEAEPDAEVLVCGSFQTVGPALDWLQL